MVTENVRIKVATSVSLFLKSLCHDCLFQIYLFKSGDCLFSIFFKSTLANILLFFTYCLSVKVAQLCPALCNPMDGSPPGSTFHGNFPGKNTVEGSVQFSSVVQSCPTLCDPKLMPIESVMPSNHLILCHLLLLLPSIFPSIRVFSSHQVAKVLEFQLQHQSFQ